jgi:citrate synthase
VDPGADPERWLTTSEVATRLGIKRTTVYAYVSRGVLRRIRHPGRRDSWFDLTEIERFVSARSTPVRQASVEPAERASV